MQQLNAQNVVPKSQAKVNSAQIVVKNYNKLIKNKKTHTAQYVFFYCLLLLIIALG